MPNTITISNAVTALNQYVTEFNPIINQQLRQGLEFERMLTFVQCERTWVESNVVIGNILQPYQSGFTPNNTETYSAVENTLQHGKVDVIFEADQLQEFFDSWKAEWFELGKSAMEWTYPRYVFENHIMPQLLQDMNNAAWAGVKTTPTAGTAGTYLQAFTGYRKVIADAITAGKVTPIVTGAPVDGSRIQWVDDFVFGMPAIFRTIPGNILMSATNAAKYAKEYQKTYQFNAQVSSNPDQPIYRVDHFKKMIVGINAMEGSNRMIFCPDVTRNMIIGTRRNQPVMPQLRFQEFDRTLKGLAEISRFYGFRFWDHVFVNDQA